MIDYYKLLEVNKNSKASDIKESYKKKVNLLRYDSFYDISVKFKAYNRAVATLLDLEQRRGYDMNLQEEYRTMRLSVTPVVPFSKNEEINKKIISRIESSIIASLLTHQDSSLEYAYSIYVHELNKKEVGSIEKLDCDFQLSDSNLYPYFETNYKFFHSKNFIKNKQKKMTII